MSMVRIVTRIIPRDAEAESVACLLRPDQVDVPVRTTSSGGPPVVTETTFCRAVPVPGDCPDPDSAVASRCEGIPGLSCLKKSRLRLVTEEAGEPRLRVVPEVSADGTCTGMLLSIPLRIPRSEIPTDGSGTTQQENNQNVQAAFSVARTEDGFPFNGIQHQEPNQNLQTTLYVANGEWHNERNIPVSSNGEQTNFSDYSALKKAVEPLRGYFQDDRCLLCGFVCSSRWGEAAMGHLATHLDNGQSFRCEKSFGSLPNLQHHGNELQLQHPKKNELQFTCDQCGKKFQGKKQLVVHLRKAHEDAAGVKCPFCDARFESGKRLKGHMSVHAGQLPHECQLCGERFRTADTLRNHSTQHRKEKRFRCEVCGKGFHKKALLQGHRSSVHGDF